MPTERECRESKPSQATSGKITAEAVRATFLSLANRWERETRNLSSPLAMTQHDAYREIVGLGESMIPLILGRLRERPHFWFAALSELAKPKKDPIDPSMYGDFDAMTNAWIKWGRESGHIKDSDPGKADRYIAKLTARFPKIIVLQRCDGPVKNAVTVKVGLRSDMN